MKKTIVMVVAIGVLLTATACEQIEDINGDDTQLATITREQLIEDYTSGSHSGSSSTTRYNSATSMMNEEIDVDKLKRKSKMSSGTFEIMAVGLGDGESVTIYCNSEIESGNMALVLVTEFNELVYEFKTDQEDEYTLTSDFFQEYTVRMGAESFVGVVELQREFK